MLKEFREFINRGNVIDLAVAVVIGAAFVRMIFYSIDEIVGVFRIRQKVEKVEAKKLETEHGMLRAG